MVSKLDQLLNFHSTALGVRTQRQQLLAANVANADVPNYKARDIDFAQALQQALAPAGAGGGLVATSAAHLPGVTPQGAAAEPLYRVPLQDSLDGNTVELDVERAQFADNAVHIEANLTFLNSQIKTMLAALQG
ncbi:MAG: flagellar basal body rod protein FlgB [Rhodospirillaceae bacterium]